MVNCVWILMRKLCSKLRHWSHSAVVWIASEHLQKPCYGSFRSICLVLPAFDQRIDIIVKFLIGDALQFLVSPVYHRFGWWIRLCCPLYDALGARLLLQGHGFYAVFGTMTGRLFRFRCYWWTISWHMLCATSVLWWYSETKRYTK